eukprot:366029-Chlamydomonas_euryale.AAC.34
MSSTLCPLSRCPPRTVPQIAALFREIFARLRTQCGAGHKLRSCVTAPPGLVRRAWGPLPPRACLVESDLSSSD